MANLQGQVQAQHVQAKQILQAQAQAQQIANMIYGSQQHIPVAQVNHRGPMSQLNFGSTPHISQQQQQPIPYNNTRPISRDSHQYVNEKGQYIAPISKNQQSYSSYVDNENGGAGTYQYDVCLMLDFYTLYKLCLLQ